MSVELVEACGFPDIVGGLFKEYTDMLIEGDLVFKQYLAIQNYDEELRHLVFIYAFRYPSLFKKRITYVSEMGIL